MKKICFISPASYPLLAKRKDIHSAGGAEAQLKTLGLAFAKDGYEVHFIVDDFGQKSIVSVDGVTIHKVPLRYLGGSNCYLMWDWVRFWRVLKNITADIHMIKVPRSLLLPLGVFRKIFNSKLIFIGQSDSDVNPDFLKKQGNYFSYLFYRIGLFATDCVIAQNRVQKDGFLLKYKKASKIIKSVITLDGRSTVPKKDHILWVGSNAPEKHPEKLLKLAQELQKFNFKMIMATILQGKGDKFVKDKLSGLPNLEYLGFVPFGKIKKYYQEASLLVSTSSREGFSNTFLQAWQFGTPVITLKVDPDNLIIKKELGRVSENFDRMRQDIEEVMINRDLRNKYGENAMKYVWQNHSLNVIIPQYYSVFKELTGDES